MKLGAVTEIIPVQSSSDMSKTESLLDIIQCSKSLSSQDIFDQLREKASDEEIINALIQGSKSEDLHIVKKTGELLDDLSIFVKTEEELKKILYRIRASFAYYDDRHLDHHIRLLPFHCFSTNPINDKKCNQSNIDIFFTKFKSDYYIDKKIARRIFAILILHHKHEVQETFQKFVNEMISSDEVKDQYEAIKYMDILKRYNCKLEIQNLKKAIDPLTRWFHGDDWVLFHAAEQFIRRVFERGSEEEISACVPILKKGCNEKNKPHFLGLLNNLNSIEHLKIIKK